LIVGGEDAANTAGLETGAPRFPQGTLEGSGIRSNLHSISDFCTHCGAVEAELLGFFIDISGVCGG
jgi:hypothetical protein